MKLRVIVPEGGIYPKWYGFSHFDFSDKASVHGDKVCYLMPLNLITGFFHRRWLWVKFSINRGRLSEVEYWNHIYDYGFKEGYKKGVNEK